MNTCLKRPNSGCCVTFSAQVQKEQLTRQHEKHENQALVIKIQGELTNALLLE